MHAQGRSPTLSLRQNSNCRSPLLLSLRPTLYLTLRPCSPRRPATAEKKYHDGTGAGTGMRVLPLLPSGSGNADYTVTASNVKCLRIHRCRGYRQ